ncbi:MAG: hypothetical protein ABIQ93_16635 [Saprospiraceae bacterium]
MPGPNKTLSAERGGAGNKKRWPWIFRKFNRLTSLMKPFFFCLFLLFSSCLKTQTAPQQKPPPSQAPRSEYARLHAVNTNNFEDWFTIRFSSDSIICETAKTSYLLHSIDESASDYCEEFKKYVVELKKRGENRRLLKIKIEADSATSYAMIDQTLEIHKHLRLRIFLFRTGDAQQSITGFSLVFPETQELIKPYLAQLYGKAILADYNLLTDCLGEKLAPRPADIPPLPPNSPDDLPYSLPALKSAMVKGDFGTKFVFVEISKGHLYLNKKAAEYSELVSMVQQPMAGYEFYILPGEQNTYGEIIKILDLLYSSREIIENDNAQKLFGKNYSELDGEGRHQVNDADPFIFWLFSMAEGVYLHGK